MCFWKFLFGKKNAKKSGFLASFGVEGLGGQASKFALVTGEKKRPALQDFPAKYGLAAVKPTPPGGGPLSNSLVTESKEQEVEHLLSIFVFPFEEN